MADSEKAALKVVNDQKNKPVLDEQAFAKLLEAAYVLQEHNRELRQIEESLERQTERWREEETQTQAVYERTIQRPAETRPEIDYTRTLAEIVETQHQIQIRHLELDQAMALVAERSERIIGGSGAGIGMHEGKMIRYHAGAGPSALPAGSEVPLETSICAICVRTGQVLRTPDVNTEFLFDPELCHPRKIMSLVAVPIYHDGNIVGALEVYFDKPQGFVEQDIHTCRLMAGLVTEAIGRSKESALKKSMAEERSSMMAAIEQLRPNLLPLAEKQLPDTSVSGREIGSAAAHSCWKCGTRIHAEEQFCGSCGAPRVSDDEQIAIHSNIAPHISQPPPVSIPPRNGASAPTQGEREEVAGVGARLSAAVHGIHLPDSVSATGADAPETAITLSSAQRADEEAIQTALSVAAKHPDLNLEDPAAALATVKKQDVAWTSAAKARDFLEGLTGKTPTTALGRFWRAHRGDFYLAIAVILVVIVVRWGFMPSAPVSATGNNPIPATASKPKPPKADENLSAFDRLLIGLGLAEAPQDTVEDKGNPDVQVWIDVHTALYYCPGSDLYGKTPNGRFTSQRDAQLDQFEPALRKACE